MLAPTSNKSPSPPNLSIQSNVSGSLVEKVSALNLQIEFKTKKVNEWVIPFVLREIVFFVF
jgi:hypothetical protein